MVNNSYFSINIERNFIAKHYAISKKDINRSKQPRRRRREIVPKSNLLRVIHLTQTKACHVLGCSMSTLKRRFYELKQDLEMERWPQFFSEINKLKIFPQIYPMSMQFILNETNRGEKELSEKEIKQISCAMVNSVGSSNR